MSRFAALPSSEAELLGVARALGAAGVGALGADERCLLGVARPASPELVRLFSRAIRGGDDPLGDAFCRLRASAVRRSLGATYTFAAIVAAMIGWSERHEPERV